MIDLYFKRIQTQTLSIACCLSFVATTTLANDTIVILPDTQYHTKWDEQTKGNITFPDTYKMQTQRIVNKHNNENPVKAVLHMGDITHNNYNSQWDRAVQAHSTLKNATIPFTLVPGNHDNPDKGEKRDTSKFNSKFGINYFDPNGTNLLWNTNLPWGHMGNNADNSYLKFKVEGHDFMAVNLEFAPRKDAICWANDLIQNNPNHHVIITTHCYQTSDSYNNNNPLEEQAKKHVCAANYGLVGSGGKHIWEELARRHSNIRMVLSGHHVDSEHTDPKGQKGNTVHEILTDYQWEQYLGTGENYGNGWIRTLEFNQTDSPMPGDGVVNVTNESVIPGINSFNWGFYNSNLTHQDHTFSFDYDFNLATYTPPSPLTQFNDFNVNKDSTGNQLSPTIGGDRNGNFVVAWEDDANEDGVYKIAANGFNGDGCQRYDQAIVSQASGQNLSPKIAVSENGNRVVMWHRNNDIYVEGYYANGNVLFSEKIVNQVTQGIQRNADIAIDNSGRFVVVWEDDNDGNGWYQIYARAFYANGNPRFGRITVNKNSSGQQFNPAVAMRDDGRFYVAFEDDQDKNGYYDILTAVWNFSGTSARSGNSTDIKIHQSSSGQQIFPDISADSSGNFVVAWQNAINTSSKDSNRNGDYNIMVSGFTSSYSRRFNDFIANDLTHDKHRLPNIDMIPRGTHKGKFAVTWEDDSDDNGYYQIYMDKRNANGSYISGDIKVNTIDDGQQYKPSVVLNNNGRGFFVWQDDLDKNGYYEIVTNDLNVFN